MFTNSYINNRDGYIVTIYNGGIMLTLQKCSVIGSNSIDNGAAGDVSINDGGANRGMLTTLTNGFINNRDG